MYQKQSFKKIEFGNCVLKSAKNWPEFLIYQSKIVPNLQIRTNIAIISWTISNLMKTRVKLEFKSESWGFCRVRTKSEINEWGRVSRSGKTRKFSGFEWSSRLKLEWGWGQSSLVGFLVETQRFRQRWYQKRQIEKKDVPQRWHWQKTTTGKWVKTDKPAFQYQPRDLTTNRTIQLHQEKRNVSSKLI